MRGFPFTAALLALALAGAAPVSSVAAELPPSGVLGVEDRQLTPEFWIDRLAAPDEVVLSTEAIRAQNAALFAHEPSMHDLAALPARLERAAVRGWLDGVSRRPSGRLWDVDGQPVAAATLDAMLANLALDRIPASQPTRFGLVVERAALRALPTDLRVFGEQGETDIDRLQETAEFPGTPVVIAHASADGEWLFVVSPRYAAWTRREYIAEGPRAAVLDYATRTPFRVVTGASVRTVYTREAPAVSRRELGMTSRLPLSRGLAPDQAVNGQTPYAAWSVDLPVRHADGTLGFSPALVQKNADTTGDWLALTRANLIRQAFKFLGERYGWGHAYDGRDCSGFVSEVYRSMGVLLPRNTSRQAVTPVLEHRLFGPGDSPAERLAAARALEVGDLVYIPGHVMMVIGHLDGEPYVIHDVLGMSYRRADGSRAHVTLNAVSVTPLLPMLFNDHETFVQRMTSIVRIRP